MVQMVPWKEHCEAQKIQHWTISIKTEGEEEEKTLRSSKRLPLEDYYKNIEEEVQRKQCKDEEDKISIVLSRWI